ncbi:AI-2E family transporter [Microaerobacter geothermalis]|uniref:AI-2E family transporter n=1 Tax=Microaerobacter geothermalis TaxID=674972 RepID=UPI001F3EE8C8|nr:AI-2E family transporter [Microaerobacter geothermalis]MCF6093991.1 AI-2E family transporter [Microaerobacter geothermalis]
MERFLKEKWILFLIYTILILIILYFLMQVQDILIFVWEFIKKMVVPFFAALIISYLLYPIVEMIYRRGVPRAIAVLLIYVIFLLLFIVVLLNTIPAFWGQFKELVSTLPQLAIQYQNFIHSWSRNIYALPEGIQMGLIQAFSQLEIKLGQMVTHVVDGAGNFLEKFFTILILPFLVFYIVKDMGKIQKNFYFLFPSRHRKKLARMLRDIDDALGQYIRGQLIVCFFVGILSYIGYKLIGLPYPIFLSFIVGLTNIIPFFGPILGAAPAIFIGLTISVKMMLLVLAVNFIIQMIEGNIISPQVMGKQLHIHPLTIIAALLVGGEMGGVIGLILAVPIFVVSKVIVQHLFIHVVKR